MSTHPTMTISFRLNGRDRDLEIEPRELLIDVLRDRLGLTGVKRSCDLQVCGSCTVLLDGDAVSACTTLALEMDEREVTSIEGLADGDQLDPVQRAFVDVGALQCGFCTPGMILAARELLDHEPEPTRERIREHLEGNLCRCTGYARIVEAVHRAAVTSTTTASDLDKDQ